MAALPIHINIAEIIEDILSDDEEVFNIIERPRRPRIFRNRVHRFQFNFIKKMASYKML